MSATSTIRSAIQAEIKTLSSELSKLEKLLSQLGDGPAASASAPVARASGGTGKRKYTRRQQASEGDVQNAIKLIEKAGKGGIKAIKLAYEMKRVGGNKVAKSDLLASEKVKMTGTGGGSTYTYIG